VPPCLSLDLNLHGVKPLADVAEEVADGDEDPNHPKHQESNAAHEEKN